MTGYVDSHCHALFAGRELQGAILSDCETVADLALKIRNHLDAAPEVTWLDLSAVKPEFPIDRNTLDEICPNIPLVIHTDDHHSICVNSRALEVAGCANHAPDISGGRFDTQNGIPNGWIHEYVAMQTIYAHQPKASLESDLAALLKAQKILLNYEITAMTEAWIDPGMPDVYLLALERNLLKIKTDLAIRITPENTEAELSFALATKQKVQLANSALLSCNTVKLFVDGVHSSGTAWLKGDSQSHGVWSSENLLKTAQRAVEAGFDLHFHACGDAAVKQAIDIVAQANPRSAVIAHADVVDPSDIPRIAQLDITINSTPEWAKDAPDHHFNYRALLDAGIKITFGSDWPVTEPDPKRAIEAAMGYRGLTRQEAEAAFGL